MAEQVGNVFEDDEGRRWMLTEYRSPTMTTNRWGETIEDKSAQFTLINIKNYSLRIIPELTSRFTRLVESPITLEEVLCKMKQIEDKLAVERRRYYVQQEINQVNEEIAKLTQQLIHNGYWIEQKHKDRMVLEEKLKSIH